MKRLPSENLYYDVVRVELDGEPKVKQGLYQIPGGEVNLYSHMAVLHRHKAASSAECDGEETEDVDIAAEKHNLLLEEEFCIDANGNLIHWFDPENYANWEFELCQPGLYEVCVQTRGVKYTPWIGGHVVRADLEGTELTARLSDGEKVINAHSRYFEERLTVLGTVNMETAGNKKISLHLLECNPEEKSGLLVTKMMLRPVKD